MLAHRHLSAHSLRGAGPPNHHPASGMTAADGAHSVMPNTRGCRLQPGEVPLIAAMVAVLLLLRATTHIN